MQNLQSSREGGCLSGFIGFARCGTTTLGNYLTIANRVETHANFPENSDK